MSKNFGGLYFPVFYVFASILPQTNSSKNNKMQDNVTQEYHSKNYAAKAEITNIDVSLNFLYTRVQCLPFIENMYDCTLTYIKTKLPNVRECSIYLS